jgi:site-specific DNA-methyltransferase (adenine-specific)
MVKLNNIYNIDCVDGLKQIDDSTIDLIVTSPPYNVGIEYDTYNDAIPWKDYLNWCKEWLSECFRVLKDDGRICLDHYIAFRSAEFDEKGERSGYADRFPLFDLKLIMEEIGYNVSKLVIWNDPTMNKLTAWGSWLSASAPHIQTPTEGILIAYKKQWKKLTDGESTIDAETFKEAVSGVWNIGTTIGYTKACFPEKLPKLCIELLTYKNDVVLDPFSGSGTTCYVAKKLGRKYIGFEISEDYYNESISRLLGSPYRVDEVVKKRNASSVVDLWRDK